VAEVLNPYHYFYYHAVHYAMAQCPFMCLSYACNVSNWSSNGKTPVFVARADPSEQYKAFKTNIICLIECLWLNLFAIATFVAVCDAGVDSRSCASRSLWPIWSKLVSTIVQQEICQSASRTSQCHCGSYIWSWTYRCFSHCFWWQL